MSFQEEIPILGRYATILGSRPASRITTGPSSRERPLISAGIFKYSVTFPGPAGRSGEFSFKSSCSRFHGSTELINTQAKGGVESVVAFMQWWGPEATNTYATPGRLKTFVGL